MSPSSSSHISSSPEREGGAKLAIHSNSLRDTRVRGASLRETRVRGASLREMTEKLCTTSQVIPPQLLLNKTLTFQEKWLRDFPWVHYVPNAGGGGCFYCKEAFKRQVSPLAKCTDLAFVVSGFKNH